MKKKDTLEIQKYINKKMKKITKNEKNPFILKEIS